MPQVIFKLRSYYFKKFNCISVEMERLKLPYCSVPVSLEFLISLSRMDSHTILVFKRPTNVHETISTFKVHTIKSNKNQDLSKLVKKFCHFTKMSIAMIYISKIRK